MLYPHQLKALNEALSKDDNGLYRYSTIVWSDIKKSAKSTLAAAVALYIAYHNKYAEIYIIANDLKQADSRVAYYFRRALELNPKLRGTTKQKGYRTTFKNGSFVEAIPIDPSGEAGSNADLIVFSELWGSHEDAKEKMWVELTLSPTKFGKSLRWIESYAGYTDESKLLWSLYKLGVQEGRRIDDDLEIFSNESARTFCLWNTKPRLPWQTPQYYSAEAAILPDGEFRRIHRNEWVTSEDTFVPSEWWSSCYEKFDEENLPKNHPMILALDAAVSHDTFGIVGVSRVPGRSEETFVRFAQKWTPPKGGKIDFQGTKDSPGPEMVIERLCKQFNVVEIAYDPMQLEDMAGRLSRKGIAWFRPFNQGADRLVADSALRARIRDRRVHHQNDPDLNEHIKNSVAKTDANSRNIRIIKKTNEAKIDLAVCLSMADHETMRLNL